MLPYFTLCLENGRYFFVLWSGNGRQMMRSANTYVTKSAARNGANAVIDGFRRAPRPEINESISLSPGFPNRPAAPLPIGK